MTVNFSGYYNVSWSSSSSFSPSDRVYALKDKLQYELRYRKVGEPWAQVRPSEDWGGGRRGREGRDAQNIQTGGGAATGEPVIHGPEWKPRTRQGWPRSLALSHSMLPRLIFPRGRRPLKIPSFLSLCPLLSACQRGRDRHHPWFYLRSSSVTVGEVSEMGQPGTVPLYLEWPLLETSRSIDNQGSSEGTLFQM